jgi:lipoprotein-anchoring transpeptidase ErfK/SrfK
MQIHIDVGDQRLELCEKGAVLRSFPVSTSALGLGTELGSYKTPVGRFRISEKIGEGEPLGAVFKGRVPTGELGADATEGDLILTRILRLDGLDEANANTRERYIYIHGTNHESLVGTAASHGCVRMRNRDILELFGLVESGTEVVIQPGTSGSTM